MKSFDEMADDFVAKQDTDVFPEVLTEFSGRFLRQGYLAGLAVGIAICADTAADFAKEKK